MPALTIFRNRNFTTKPFAGDDLQIICIVLGAYRAIQLVCLVPLVINQLVKRFQGTDLYINGYGPWCEQYQQYDDAGLLVLTVAGYEKNQFTRDTFGITFIILASIFAAVDVAWILMAWVGATVGTPTQPMGRDVYLRKLIIFKMFAITLFPVVLMIFGLLKVYSLRKDNYGCGDTSLVGQPPDSGLFFALFCILLVTYALELLVWPAVVANRIMRWIKTNKLTHKKRYATQAKGERLEQCLGGLLKCISVLCCNKQGGKEIKNQGEMKDFASNLMEFANNDTKVDVTLSDMYVGGKLLARVQAERRVRAIMKLQHASNTKGVRPEILEEEEESAPDASSNRRTLLAGQDEKRRRSILTLQTDESGKDCIVVEKNVLTSTNGKDVEVLRKAEHYSIFAQFIYFHVRMALEDLLATDATTFIRDFDMMGPVDYLSFAMFDVPHAHIFYANFYNGIAATPYAILVDEEEKSVVIAVRGTLSLEDWVIDLQYVPQPLEKVGELCGFDGKGHHCHKGVLTRCKWMYNDIKKHRVLKHLYSSESPYSDYNLVVVGHSLGGGCAQVLSLMLRPSFPSLKCFAFEPPGCIFDDVLSEDCKEWITSIVRHEDVVPRVTQPNLENLRDEFFDVLARIKVTKSRVFHDVRAPCAESHLASRNDKLMCPKGEIEKDTEFYKRLQQFRNERAMKNQTGDVSVKLYIPGEIIHLVDTKGDETKYVPYYASRYEFNQVILSGRMLADHSMPPLVQILRNLDLDTIHEVRTWHRDDDDIEEDDEEVRLIIPFSNPQGRVPLLLMALTLTACVLTVISNQGCKYVSRSNTTIQPDDGGASYPGLGLNTGLWSYNLKQCSEGACNVTDPFGQLSSNMFEDTSYCQQFDSEFPIDIYWRTARVCGSLSVIFSFLGLGMTALATSTKLKQRTWIVICMIFLISTLFQGLQFLYLKGGLCTEMTLHTKSGGKRVVTTEECTLSTHAKYGIASIVLLFITAIGCSYMARRARMKQ